MGQSGQAKKLTRVRRVTGKISRVSRVKGATSRVGSGQEGLQKTTGRVGLGQKSLFSNGSRGAGRPGSAVDPQHPYNRGSEMLIL